ncbi:uncharacterized protein LODBEIA_P02680 [Lodderomyces beijingensis]|uniref:Uncharacterized protein n=1 Tax=Lodderomyces beijingensis TaxID=1775926 RepID=A0ABP0ZCX7_9ASCO
MLNLLDLVFNTLTTLIPLLHTVKALDSSIEFHYHSYQFLLNYWLYFITINYITQQNGVFNLLGHAIKLWLFYGTANNNLCILNDVLFKASERNWRKFEKTANVLVGKFAPRFGDFNLRVHNLGVSYCKPVESRYEVKLDVILLQIVQIINFWLPMDVKQTSGSHQDHATSKQPPQQQQQQQQQQRYKKLKKLKKQSSFASLAAAVRADPATKFRSTSNTSSGCNSLNNSPPLSPIDAAKFHSFTSSPPAYTSDLSPMANGAAAVYSKRRAFSGGDASLNASIGKFRSSKPTNKAQSRPVAHGHALHPVDVAAYSRIHPYGTPSAKETAGHVGNFGDAVRDKFTVKPSSLKNLQDVDVNELPAVPTPSVFLH